MKNTIILFLLSALIIFTSCSKKNDSQITKDTVKTYTIPALDNYTNDSNISDMNGITKMVKRYYYMNYYYYRIDDKPRVEFKLAPQFYFPFKIKGLNGIQETGIDTINNEMYTEYYIYCKEPLLYNYYLGKDRIRMDFYSELRTVLFTTLTKYDNKVIMNIATNNSDGTLKKLSDKEFPLAIWDTLLTRLDKSGFWKLKPFEKKPKEVEDGYKAVIECHLKEGYWFYVWEDKSPLEETMFYIMYGLAGFKL